MEFAQCDRRVDASESGEHSWIFELGEAEFMRVVVLDDDEPATDSSGPCSVLMLLAGHLALERAVEQVDEEVYREVLRLSLRGRDNVQIAAELGIP